MLVKVQCPCSGSVLVEDPQVMQVDSRQQGVILSMVVWPQHTNTSYHCVIMSFYKKVTEQNDIHPSHHRDILRDEVNVSRSYQQYHYI